MIIAILRCVPLNQHGICFVFISQASKQASRLWRPRIDCQATIFFSIYTLRRLLINVISFFTRHHIFLRAGEEEGKKTGKELHPHNSFSVCMLACLDRDRWWDQLARSMYKLDYLLACAYVRTYVQPLADWERTRRGGRTQTSKLLELIKLCLENAESMDKNWTYARTDRQAS